MGPRNPSAGEALLQKLRSHEGDLGSQYHVTRRVQTAGIDPSEQGRDLLRAIVAAVITSTIICCVEGGESTPSKAVFGRPVITAAAAICTHA